MMKALIAAALLAAACGKGVTGAPAPIEAHVALTAVSSCDQLGKNVQDAAVRQMRAQLDQAKVNNWGGGPVAAGGNGPTSGPALAAPPAGYTTTNVQVAGVDEADFMKNDGTRIFVLSGQSLWAATSWPPRDLATAGSMPIEGWPQSMFLDGNTVVVLSTLWGMAAGGGAGLCPMGVAALGPVMCMGTSTTKVTMIDASALNAMKVVGEQYLPGYGSYARRVGSSVRVVLSDSVRWPDGVKWWVDWDPSYSDHHDKLVAALDALEDANESVIRRTPAAQWFPDGKRKLSDGTIVDLGYQCSDFYLSNAPERLGLLTVATLDVSDPSKAPARTSIVGEPGVVYATAQHLYVASDHWWWWDAPGQQDHTYVHQFDISDPGRAAYLASGGFAGHVGNQYAMDEYQGYLRVAATTTERQLGDTNNPWQLKVGNHVAVLDANNGLGQVGETGLLVADEGIRGVRFLGDKGFVDTFRGIDPLVTLDLRDPTQPKKVAELTMPGFSTYLQPVDDTHLLAIGTDLPPPDPVTGQVDWSKRALQLSLFDITDLANPVRTQALSVGTMNAWSEALYDPHAFNWYGPRKLLAIPFSDWLQPGSTANWYDQFVSDVRLFKVDATMTAIGSLGMGDVYLQAGDGAWSYWYQPWVRRSVLATDTGGADYVYAISDAGFRVAALGDLQHPLATALLPR